MRWWVVAAFGAASLGARGGCGPAGAPVAAQTDTCATSIAPPIDGMPAVMLGRDADPFQPLVDGDVLPLNTGPQGGQHVFVSIRFYTPAASAWQYALTLSDGSGATVASGSAPIAACAGWNVSQKVRVFMTTAAPAGGTLRVVASSRDGGASPTETVSVRIGQ